MSNSVEKIILEFDPEATNLLPALKNISAVFGYIGEKEAQKVSEYFNVPLSKVYETASFYDKINIRKKAELLIQVCSGANCAVGGSFAVVREIENYFRIKVGDENLAYRQAGNPKIKLEEISCLGQCGEGPIMIVNDKVYTNVTRSSVYEILEKWL
jgi:NADH-quinone oxidoreductase subunit E